MSTIDKSLLFFGRFVAGFFFLATAFQHFTNVRELAPLAAAKGVILPELAVVVGGALLLVGGVCIACGVASHLAIAAIAVYLVPVSLVMHDFWAIDDAVAAQEQMAQFYKNVGLLGLTLMTAATPGAWTPSTSRSAARAGSVLTDLK